MNILFRLGLIGWVALIIIGATSRLKATEVEVALNFETLFPDSPYKRVHHACMTIWQELRSLQAKPAADEQLNSTHRDLIEKLALVYARVYNLLKKPNLVSHDDLEYLAGVFNLINRDFMESVRTPTPETICNQILIEQIQNKIQTVLK